MHTGHTAARVLKAFYISLRTHVSIFTHISVHILPFRLTREGQGGCVGPACGRPPRTCHRDQWLVRSSGGELGGKDLAAPCGSVALNLASHPPSMLWPGGTSANRKHAVNSPLPTSYDVIIVDKMPCILHLHCCRCRRITGQVVVSSASIVKRLPASCEILLPR